MGSTEQMPPLPMPTSEEPLDMTNIDFGPLPHTTNGSTIDQPHSRAPPRHLARVVFFERHLISTFME